MVYLSHRLVPFVVLSSIFMIRISLAQQPIRSPLPDDRFKSDILVVVAHPDDESIIAGYLARAVFDEHKRVSVVFMTRGDAGQNLVGFEQSQSLAEIREMEAREALASIGIKNVWFLRGADTPWLEIPDVLRSLETWNHGNVLEQVVRFMRLTRPDVVISMLPDVVVGENHEDHQAAGVVATEAFDLSGDPTSFPEQVAAPADRLWYANLTEGLHPWQPKKLYFFTDASDTKFTEGKGPEYSMTEVSPSQHISYAVIAAKELSNHLTQYGDHPQKDISSGNMSDYNQPLTLILGKSLVGGDATADVFAGVKPGPVAFSHVRGYVAEDQGDYSIELGGGWAFYKRFWPAHNLDLLPQLLSPQIGVGTGQDFPVPIVLHNNTYHDADMELKTVLPPGWSVDSNSAQYAHHELPQGNFDVPQSDYVPVVVRLVAPDVHSPAWATVTWEALVENRIVGKISMKFLVRTE